MILRPALEGLVWLWVVPHEEGRKIKTAGKKTFSSLGLTLGDDILLRYGEVKKKREKRRGEIKVTPGSTTATTSSSLLL